MDKILADFKRNLIEGLDDVSDQLVSNIKSLDITCLKGDLIVLRIFVKDQIDSRTIMDNFISHILPHKEEIKRRNDKFFIDKTTLFSVISKETLINFKKLWRSALFDDEDREALWKYADVLIVLAERYIKLKNVKFTAINATTEKIKIE
jgi:hypothetical protein